MKKFLLTCLACLIVSQVALFLPISAYAQQYLYARRIMQLPTLPASCFVGDVVAITQVAATSGIYRCVAANVWAPMGTVGATQGTQQYLHTQGAITASNPFISHTGEWNGAGVSFVDDFRNITDTASAVASYLVMWQVNGANIINISKAGVFTTAAGGSIDFLGRSRYHSAADGRINFTNNALAGISRMTLGAEAVAYGAIEPVTVGGQFNGFRFAKGDGTTVVFADLGAASNGVIVYCSDCTKATPCAGAGTGALAKRLAGAWDCD